MKNPLTGLVARGVAVLKAGPDLCKVFFSRGVAVLKAGLDLCKVFLREALQF